MKKRVQCEEESVKILSEGEKGKRKRDNVLKGSEGFGKCWALESATRTDGQTDVEVGSVRCEELEFVRIVSGVMNDQEVLRDEAGRVVKRVKGRAKRNG